MRTKRRQHLKLAAAIVAAALALGLPANALTAVKPYAIGLNGYQSVALLSVGDQVPEASGAGMYQMVGIPDGLGAHPQGSNTRVYMNHELVNTQLSSPNVGGPANRGAFVSRFLIKPNGRVLSGERAYDWVYQDNTLVGPAPEVGNSTRAFARFCSASLAGEAEGFTRNLFFTNEEEAAEANTFDGKGGQTVVVTGNNAYALSRLGHFSKENDVAQPRTDAKTVIFSLEDGPPTPDSQLYLYVGQKHRGNVLARNGLDNGNLFVFVADNPAITNENQFTSGSVPGHWVQIPNAGALTATALETASDGVGALGFVRIEDGAFSKTSVNDFYFVTTGDASQAENQLGRAYHLQLDPADPVGPNVTLNVIYDADTVVEGGGDIALSPDNIDTSSQYLMIQEDGTSASRPVMTSKGRDGRIWRITLTGGITPVLASAISVAELDPPGRDGVAVTAGVWETSGIISTPWLGADTWLFDVQAHPPTTPPAAGTVEDGQLLLLRPVPA